jgi:hypothetical protein
MRAFCHTLSRWFACYAGEGYATEPPPARGGGSGSGSCGYPGLATVRDSSRRSVADSLNDLKQIRGSAHTLMVRVRSKLLELPVVDQFVGGFA